MPESDRRPRLTPAVADVRRAVRETIADLPEDALVLVALSGGPDSLALAAATAFAVALFGLMLALPPPVAARRSEARWLRFMIGALALTMLGSAMLGLVSAPQHGWYVRARPGPS